MASTTFAESKPARLVVEIRPPVARIVLRHAPLNVIDIAMMEELAGALAEAEARSDISVVVLVGEGKDFSAGVEVAAHTPDKVEEMLLSFTLSFTCWSPARRSPSLPCRGIAWVAALNLP